MTYPYRATGGGGGDMAPLVPLDPLLLRERFTHLNDNYIKILVTNLDACSLVLQGKTLEFSQSQHLFRCSK